MPGAPLLEFLPCLEPPIRIPFAEPLLGFLPSPEPPFVDQPTYFNHSPVTFGYLIGDFEIVIGTFFEILYFIRLVKNGRKLGIQ